MVTRIRLDADGPTAAAIEAELMAFVAELQPLFVDPPMPGELVISRQLGELDAEHGGRRCFTGRLLLHPNTAPTQPAQWIASPADIGRAR